MVKPDRRRGRTQTEHFTKMHRDTMLSPAFHALSCSAKALYPFLKLEWKGPRANNNGAIKLSHRQAADLLNVSKDTATRAFHDLQAKGFLYVQKHGVIGIQGKARCPEYELTELPLPGSRQGRRLYLDWKPGNDFEVTRHSGQLQSRSKTEKNNTPSLKRGRTSPENEDEIKRSVRKTRTVSPDNADVQKQSVDSNVIKSRTSLSTTTVDGQLSLF